MHQVRYYIYNKSELCISSFIDLDIYRRLIKPSKTHKKPLTFLYKKQVVFGDVFHNISFL